MKNNEKIQLLQTRVKKYPDHIKVYVRQNNHHSGTIDLIKKEFISVQRSPKNLFKLFKSPALGLNIELLELILPRFGIEKIKIIYLGKVLETTCSKWKKLGIRSPYCDDRVDSQILLGLDLINMIDAEKYAIKTEEPSLFEEVTA